MSEKILDAKPKGTKQQTSRNKVKRFDLYPGSIENKTISQLVREKYSPNKCNKKTRNISNIADSKSNTMRNITNDKKLITSMKNSMTEGAGRLATKHQNFVSISKYCFVIKNRNKFNEHEVQVYGWKP